MCVLCSGWRGGGRTCSARRALAHPPQSLLPLLLTAAAAGSCCRPPNCPYLPGYPGTLAPNRPVAASSPPQSRPASFLLPLSALASWAGPTGCQGGPRWYWSVVGGGVARQCRAACQHANRFASPHPAPWSACPSCLPCKPTRRLSLRSTGCSWDLPLPRPALVVQGPVSCRSCASSPASLASFWTRMTLPRLSRRPNSQTTPTGTEGLRRTTVPNRLSWPRDRRPSHLSYPRPVHSGPAPDVVAPPPPGAPSRTPSLPRPHRMARVPYRVTVHVVHAVLLGPSTHLATDLVSSAVVARWQRWHARPCTDLAPTAGFGVVGSARRTPRRPRLSPGWAALPTSDTRDTHTPGPERNCAGTVLHFFLHPLGSRSPVLKPDGEFTRSIIHGANMRLATTCYGGRRPMPGTGSRILELRALAPVCGRVSVVVTGPQGSEAQSHLSLVPHPPWSWHRQGGRGVWCGAGIVVISRLTLQGVCPPRPSSSCNTPVHVNCPVSF